jgi:hypothetical protein
LIGLRKWAALHCGGHAGGTSGGAIFSREGLLLTGESQPSSEADWFALAAARNVWLAPYPADAPQVRALAETYSEALSISGGDIKAAKQTVCMSALLAPQFWIGNAVSTEPLKRLALEIGHAVPTMAELDDYRLGKLTLAAYVEQLQSDPVRRQGYLAAVRGWHKSWWGLRDFIDSYTAGTIDNTGYRAPVRDARSGFSGSNYAFTTSKPGEAYARRILRDGNPLLTVASETYAADYNLWDAQEGCYAEKADGQVNVQPFDPRTTMILFEHRNNVIQPPRWEIAGAHVLDGALSEYEALVRAYDPAFSAAGACKRHTELYPAKWEGDRPHPLRRQVPGFPEYWECKGSVSLRSGGFRPTDVRDFRNVGYSDAQPYAYPSQYQAYDLSSPASKSVLATYTNALVGTVHDKFALQDRRIRRKSPTGWQDGVSEVRTWYTGAKAYSCNALTRFHLTCLFRPAMNSTYSWATPADFGKYGAVNESLHDGAFYSVGSSANPHLLNQFRCAKPQLAGLPAAGVLSETQKILASRDEEFYPRGYGLGADYSSAPLAAGNLNPVIVAAAQHIGLSYVSTMIRREGDATPSAPESAPSPRAHPEYRAIERLNEDLNNEPYRLLEHVLTGDRPYSEMFTAKYSFGREELELFYRSQGLLLPAYPPGYANNLAPDSEARSLVRRFERSGFPAVPASWNLPFLEAPGTEWYYSSKWLHPNGTDAVKASGQLPPLPSAGILSMPAFLGPVSQKMRTLSSRFFTRILCGEPSVYIPQGAARDLHRRYMSHPSNPAPASHLDESKGCFTCHVNLDPLAAALSKNFLPNVQKDEVAALTGEFGLLGGAYRADPLNAWLGGRSAGEKGEGAFLGKPVSGVEQVGEVMAESDLMYSCAVNRAFQEIYGRQPQLADIEGVRTTASSFKAHRSFNRMIRELVSLKQFSTEN